MKTDTTQKLTRREVTAFKENAYYERIARLQRDDPKTFDVLSLPERLSLAAYLHNKNKATGKASVID